jgi:predicted nucleotidyltransferase
MVRQVAQRLDTLRDSVVFVGGAVVDLLITDPAAPSIRPTKDVDVIVEVTSLHDYYKLGDLLRARGFKEDSQSEGGPVCRWVIDGIKVDVMPMEGHILGFSNAFYPVATETAATTEISEGLAVRLISAPCFLATKLEAFRDRGDGDFMGSPDMEDVVAVLDGRGEIVDEIMDSPDQVKDFLSKAFSLLLEEEGFLDALPGHLGSSETPGRVSILIDRIQAIASMAAEAV